MQTPSQVDALVRARALARWEGEGGALAPSTEADSIDDVSLALLARPLISLFPVQAQRKCAHPKSGAIAARGRFAGSSELGVPSRATP